MARELPLGIYDSYASADEVLHAINWVLLVGAFHAFRFRSVTDRRCAIADQLR